MDKIRDTPFGYREPVWGFLLAALYIVGMPLVFYPPLIRMIDDVRLHYSGTVAAESHCTISVYQGTRSSSWSIHVSYVSQEGISHLPDIDSFMWWRMPDRGKACTVRYDPKSPDHISTDLGFERVFGRALTYLLLLLLPLFLEVAALVMAATYLFGSNRFESAEQGVGAMGGETHLSRSGYCASLLRRRNWRLFVGGVSLFTVGVALLWVPPSGIHYWPQFFEGPRRLHSVDLDAGTTLPTNAQWVQIQAMQPLDTGVETQGGHYLLAHVEGYPLLIHVETRDPKASYRGELKVINQTLRTELVKKGYRVGSPEFPSLYLETTDDPARAYRSEGVMDLVFASPVLLVGFTALWLSLRRALDYRRHPFARSLARRGSATAFVQEIDAEMAGGARAFKRLRITSHWLIVEKFWTAAPMRMSDVVWVYYKYDKTGSYCVACDRWRESLEMSLKSATAKKVQKIIAALAPRAVDGYDAARKQLWESEKDAAKFPDLVRTQASPGRLG